MPDICSMDSASTHQKQKIIRNNFEPSRPTGYKGTLTSSRLDSVQCLRVGGVNSETSLRRKKVDVDKGFISLFPHKVLYKGPYTEVFQFLKFLLIINYSHLQFLRAPDSHLSQQGCFKNMATGDISLGKITSKYSTCQPKKRCWLPEFSSKSLSIPVQQDCGSKSVVVHVSSTLGRLSNRLFEHLSNSEKVNNRLCNITLPSLLSTEKC